MELGPLCEGTVQMVLLVYGTNRIGRGIHSEQCMVQVDHANQPIVGMDNENGVNRPCNREDCGWEP
jgi:hypothetical protein